MFYKIKDFKTKRQSKAIERNLFLSVVLILDTKKEIMTQLRLKILNY